MNPDEPVVRHGGKAVQTIHLKLHRSCSVKAAGCSYAPERNARHCTLSLSDHAVNKRKKSISAKGSIRVQGMRDVTSAATLGTTSAVLVADLVAATFGLQRKPSLQKEKKTKKISGYTPLAAQPPKGL